MNTNVQLTMLEQYPQIQRLKLARPEPKRGSRDNSQKKSSRESSKEKPIDCKINGLTLDQYLNKQKTHQHHNLNDISHDDAKYFMDGFEINELDEDLYSESMVESKHHNR